jgi:hypothetical protein
MIDVLERSFFVGCIGGFAFFVLSISGLFMVSGNGTAPAFTEAMIMLNQVPFRLVGAKVGESMLVIGAVFWAVVVAVATFVATVALKKKKDA